MGPDQDLIDEVVATFPRTFGLRGHKGVFRISAWDSFFTGPGPGQGRLMLYIAVRIDDKWVAFAKSTKEELRREIVPLPEEKLKRRRTKDARYEVVVSNIGSVHEGSDREEAEDVYYEYVDMTKSRRGRASGEDVALFEDDDIILEHLQQRYPRR
jgi:hypothetical protein